MVDPNVAAMQWQNNRERDRKLGRPGLFAVSCGGGWCRMREIALDLECFNPNLVFCTPQD